MKGTLSVKIGIESEYKVAAWFREQGWSVFRPGLNGGTGRGIVDVLAICGPEILCIQCKTAQAALGRADTEQLVSFCTPINGIPVFTRRLEDQLFFYKLQGGTWIEVSKKEFSHRTLRDRGAFHRYFR